MLRVLKLYLIAFCCAVAASPVLADKAAPAASPQGIMNKMLAPGPLMEAHKQLEQTQCLTCHAAGKGVPDGKCLDCHKDIRASMRQPASFHKLAGKPCIACHSDHKGRALDTTHVDQTKFDHAKTGFPLSKEHAKLKCAECHIQKPDPKLAHGDAPRFFGATATCIACHKKDDVHAFTGKFAGKDCGSCHSDKSWKTDLHFDHKQASGFPLLGKHADVACVKCHARDVQAASRGVKAFQWTGIGRTCKSCHADYHGFDGLKSSKLGALAQCETCHTERGWKTALHFDHNRDTHYRIDGKHVDLACNACHKPLPPKEQIAAQGLPVQTSGNQPAANQSTPAPTLLRQYHWPDLARKGCESCHKSPHTKTFPPALQAKSCSSCHVTSGWTQLAKINQDFDHDRMTRFALKGRHAQISCASCHVQNHKDVYRFPTAAKGFCVSCHSNIHQDEFRANYPSDTCADCHDTRSFAKLKPFDHNRSTLFALTGDHLRIRNQCNDCHTRTTKLLPTTPPKRAGRFVFAHQNAGYCVDCHTNAHFGQFHPKYADAACTTCHTTTDFVKRLPFDHDATGFAISGKHAGLACTKCHTPTDQHFDRPQHPVKDKFIFPDLATKDCAVCHKDPHQGKLGSSCSDCHNVAHPWASVEDFHKNFTLKGTHNLLACRQCHGEDGKRRLSGMSERCEFCHAKDDAHNHGLPQCADCHTQQVWSMVTFHHSMTEFPLLGMHRTLECNACHRAGQYQGTPTDCQSCHVRDAFGASFPNHRLPGFDQCQNCHNQFSFKAKQ